MPTGTAHVVYPWTGERVQQDDGTMTPRQFTYVEIPDDPAQPFVVVECDHRPADLVPVVIAAHIIQGSPHAREVASKDLRQLDLERAVSAALTTASHQPEKSAPGTLQDLAQAASSDRSLKSSVTGLRKRARARVTPDRLAEVAQIYRGARATGAPTKAVAEHFGFPSSTASLYVRRAREAGMDMGDEAQP